jgi:hypothetical protein
LSRVARSEQPGEILKRALAYPYAAPARSFLQLDGRARELPDGDLDLAGREPLLAYGANAAPDALARKLASAPAVPLPVLRAELAGFDVVYSAHVSPYGAVPATLHPSPGTTAPVFVLYPTAEQRALLGATEPNYELTRLRSIELRLAQEATPLAGQEALSEVDAFLSRHGCLRLSGSPLALAAIRSTGRSFVEMGEAAVLELVRTAHSPDLDLEVFVSACVKAGGLAPLPRLWGP